MCTHRGILEDWQVLQDVVLDLGRIVGANPVLCRAAHKALGAVLILLSGLVSTNLAVYIGQVYQQVTVGTLHSDWGTQLVTGGWEVLGGVSRMPQELCTGPSGRCVSPAEWPCRMIPMFGACSRHA